MASEKQLESWLKKAKEKVERFRDEKVVLETEIYKLNKKLATCTKHFLEAEDLVLKYQDALNQLDPSKVPAFAPVHLQEEKAPEIGVNGWPTSFIEKLNDCDKRVEVCPADR